MKVFTAFFTVAAMAASAAQALVANDLSWSLSVMDSRDTRFDFSRSGLLSDDPLFRRADITNERLVRRSWQPGASPATDPQADGAVAAAWAGQAGFGLLRAFAYARFSLANADWGDAAGVTARSYDEFVITPSNPALLGETGQATAKMLVTGGVSVDVGEELPAGSDQLVAGYAVSLVKYDGTETNNAPATDVFDTATPDVSGGFDSTTGGLARGPKDLFSFVYGETFTLRSGLTASANAATRYTDNGRFIVEAPQTISANFLSTALLGFVLPDGASLIATGSGAEYAQASAEAALDQLLAGAAPPPTSVPLPAPAILLASGLAALGLAARRRRGAAARSACRRRRSAR